MYLNVTDLTTYNVGHDSLCVRWTPHRAATSYRLRINPFDSKCCTYLLQIKAAGKRIFELLNYATWQSITSISFYLQLPRVELRRSLSEALRVATASMAWALTLFTTSQCTPKPPTWKGQEWALRRGHVRRDLPCQFISKKVISHASRGFRNVPSVSVICLCFVLQWSNLRKCLPNHPPHLLLQQSPLLWMVKTSVCYNYHFNDIFTDWLSH